MEWDPATRSAGDNYRLLCSVVAPRPIAWVTTCSKDGLVNVAPFSWFNAVCANPPILMLAVADHRDGRHKDTVANLLEVPELVVHVVGLPNLHSAVATSAEYPRETSEATELGLATVPSRRVRVPGLAASPVRLEARLHRMEALGNHPQTNLVLAEVVHVHADDAVLDDHGLVSATKWPFASRLGGHDYAAVLKTFEVPRPPRPSSNRNTT